MYGIGTAIRNEVQQVVVKKQRTYAVASACALCERLATQGLGTGAGGSRVSTSSDDAAMARIAEAPAMLQHLLPQRGRAHSCPVGCSARQPPQHVCTVPRTCQKRHISATARAVAQSLTSTVVQYIDKVCVSAHENSAAAIPACMGCLLPCLHEGRGASPGKRTS